MRRETTLSGGIVIESDDGRSGAIRDAAGNVHRWGDDGPLMLSELGFEPTGEGLEMTDVLPDPLTPRAAALLVSDGRSRSSTAPWRTPGGRVSPPVGTPPSFRGRRR